MRNSRAGVGVVVRVRRTIAIAAVLLGVAADTAAAQLDVVGLAAAAPRGVGPRWDGSQLPFAVGERLAYSVRIAGTGAAGKGEMTVSGPVDLRGVEVLVLKSEMKAGVGPFTGADRTQSWLDVGRMAALRFVKDERRVLSRRRESVDVFPETQRWKSSDGSSGASPSSASLDELSFIYFLRTLPLTADTTFEVSRHFDAGRNPVGLRILARETITTRAGEFATVLVEMRVKDPHNYRGEGVIRIHFTDDACRLPVRIESTIPEVGKTVLTLDSATRPDGRCVTGDR